MRLPTVEMHNDWKSWAQALLKVLSEKKSQPFAKVQSYTVADATALFPPEDGYVIQVTDETGGCTLATSYGGVWKRVSDGATIA